VFRNTACPPAPKRIVRKRTKSVRYLTLTPGQRRIRASVTLGLLPGQTDGRRCA
jgi:hypothetical protein